ncbi:hypothetical protein [Halostella sp. PRR32]|uniref:hypothetical protein n=1 Tax=Halostella sp. PRR32 TaxID=3098147 RepID=UPI002B1D0DC1|nr:hypothetical protein [Halostella sp. PRR32]
MVNTNRRTVLKTVGASSAALLSGCSGVLDGGSDDDSSSGGAPDYRDWFPTASKLEGESGGYLYGVFDMSALAELEDDSEDQSDSDSSQPTDPLVANPLGIYLAAAFLSLSYSQMGLTSVMEGIDKSSNPIDRWILVGGYSVFEGSFDTEKLESNFDQMGYDDPSEVGDFSLYEHPDNPYAVGIRSDTIVAVSGNDLEDPGSVATAIIDAERGEVTREHEDNDTFDKVTKAVTDGDLLYGVLPESETFESESGSDDLGVNVRPFTNAVGLSQSLAIDSDASEATARAGVVYDSEDDVDTDKLESGLGAEASEFDLQQDGSEVSIEATYEEDDVSG